MKALPWQGLHSIPQHKIPPFDLASTPLPQQVPSSTSSEDPSVTKSVEEMMASAGYDEHSHPRLGYDQGKDLMTYPRAKSTVAYNKQCLDGSFKIPKKRKREGEK